jgi:hypothetical protein
MMHNANTETMRAPRLKRQAWYFLYKHEDGGPRSFCGGHNVTLATAKAVFNMSTKNAEIIKTNNVGF